MYKCALLLLLFTCLNNVVTARLCLYTVPCGQTADIAQVNLWDCGQDNFINDTVHQPLYTDEILLTSNCTDCFGFSQTMLQSSTPLNYSSITVGCGISLSNTSIEADEFVISLSGSYSFAPASLLSFVNVSTLVVLGSMTFPQGVPYNIDTVNVSGTFITYSTSSFSILNVLNGGIVNIKSHTAINYINIELGGTVLFAASNIKTISNTTINNQGKLILERLYMAHNDSSSVYSGPQSELHVHGLIGIPITMQEGTFYGYSGVQLTKFSANRSTMDLTSAPLSIFRGQSNFTENFWLMGDSFNNVAHFEDVVFFKGENHLQGSVSFNATCVLDGTLNVGYTGSDAVTITAAKNAVFLLASSGTLFVNLTGDLHFIVSNAPQLGVFVNRDSTLDITVKEYTYFSSIDGEGKCTVDSMMVNIRRLLSNSIRELHVTSLTMETDSQINFTAENSSAIFQSIKLFQRTSELYYDTTSFLKMSATKGYVTVHAFVYNMKCQDVKIPQLGVRLRELTATSAYAPSAPTLSLSEDGESVDISYYGSCMTPKYFVMKDESNNQTWTGRVDYYYGIISWKLPSDISPCSSNLSIHSVASTNATGASSFFQITPRSFTRAINITSVDVTYNTTGVAMKWNPESFYNDVRCGSKPTQVFIKPSSTYYPSFHTNISEGFIFMTPFSYQPVCQAVSFNMSLVYGAGRFNKTYSTKAAEVFSLSSVNNIPTDDVVTYYQGVEVVLYFQSINCNECIHMVKLDKKIWSSNSIVKAVINEPRDGIYNYESWTQCQSIVVGDIYYGHVSVQQPMDTKIMAGIVSGVVCVVVMIVVVVVIVIRRRRANAAAERAPLMNSNRSSIVSEMPEEDGALISPIALPPPMLRASQEIS